MSQEGEAEKKQKTQDTRLSENGVAERGGIRVIFEWIGEGNWGDYDPGDKEDTPLLRFTVQRHTGDGKYEEFDDASYCTGVSAFVEKWKKDRLAERVLEHIYFAAVGSGGRIKKLCERLSWIDENSEIKTPDVCKDRKRGDRDGDYGR